MPSGPQAAVIPPPPQRLPSTSANTTSAAYVTPIWNHLKTRLTTTKSSSKSMDTKTANSNKTASNSLEDTRTRANRKMMIQEMDEIITHELIHIYDVRQLHLNLVHCNDLAYSEIRAAREAECSSFNTTTVPSIIRNSQSRNHQQDRYHQKQLNDCVRTRATTATKNIFPSFRAHQCIHNVYKEAMADLRPFATTTTHNNNNVDTNQTDGSSMEDDPYVSNK